MRRGERAENRKKAGLPPALTAPRQTDLHFARAQRPTDTLMRLVQNSLHQEVAATLREQIFAGTYAPGSEPSTRHSRSDSCSRYWH